MTTIPNDPTLNGCIVLEQGTSWLSKQIILHNRWIARIEHHEPMPYSHAEFLLWNEDERFFVTNQTTVHLKAKTLYTIGARERGAELTEAALYYSEGNNLLVMAPRVALTTVDTYNAFQFYKFMDPTKYQWTNFLSWIGYIHTFGILWLGNHGKKTTYCYKLAALFAKTIGKWHTSTDIVSVYDLHDAPDYQPMPV